MSLTKTDFDNIDTRIKNITLQEVEEISNSNDLPPTIDQLNDNNKTYSIVAAILFIDIRKSTYLSENSQAKSMVKIYRSFMRMAVDCVRKNGGVTRQFLGDRIMGVFIDSTDDEGTITEKASDKAVNAARSLQTVIDYSLNRHLKNNVNGKIIECGIGIDYGKVLVTQVGMYGVENDYDKENETSCVWVGDTTNHASKYADIASGGEIFISDSVYKALSDEYKEVWIKAAKYKGTKLFQGYVVQDYYLDFVDEIGNPVKVESDNSSEIDTANQLSDGIKEIERLYSDLIKREKELNSLEILLNEENESLKKKLESIQAENKKLTDDYNLSQKMIKELVYAGYDTILDFIKDSWCNNEYIEQISLDRWKDIENALLLFGKLHGYTDIQIKNNAMYLINVFAFYNDFEKAYEYMVAMAKENTYWVYINEKVMKWACTEYCGHQLIDSMEKNLVNDKIQYDRRQEYKETIAKAKKIRGF